MPNLAMGPILPAVLGIYQAEADIQNTQARTQLINQSIQTQQKHDQADEAFRQAQIAAQTASGVKQTSTTSVQDQESSALSPAAKFVNDTRAQIQQQMETLKAAKMYPASPYASQVALHAQTEIDRLNGELRAGTKDLMTEKRDQFKETANLARDADSPEDIANLIDYVKTIQGPAAAFNLDRSMPHDANGNYLFNDQTKAALKPIISQNTTNSDKARAAKDKADLALQQQREKREQEQADETRRWHDKEASLHQAGMAQSERHFQEALKLKTFNVDSKAMQASQKQLDATAKDLQIDEHLHSYDLATKVDDILQDPAQGVRSVTTPQARALVQQYERQVNNFRYRSGGRYTEEQINDMKGMFQKFENWAENVGRGDPLLDKQTMHDMTTTMKSLAMDQVVRGVKDDLTVLDKLRGQGQNPLVPSPHAATAENIDLLKKQHIVGKDKKLYPLVNEIEDSKGRPYLVFYPGDSKSDYYPLPTEPPERELVPIPLETPAY